MVRFKNKQINKTHSLIPSGVLLKSKLKYKPGAVTIGFVMCSSSQLTYECPNERNTQRLLILEVKVIRQAVSVIGNLYIYLVAIQFKV